MSFGGMGGDIKFVVRVQNEERLKQLNADIKKQQDAIRALNATLGRAKISQGQFFAQAATHGAQLRTLTAEVTKLQRGVKSMEPGRMGLGLMALGNLADDLQYGFRSIVNNIPQVVYMLGGSGGMAGGAAIAAVAVNQLVEHWGKLTDMFQSAWLNVPAERLEKLRVRAEKASEAFDKLTATPSKVQAKQIDILTDAILGGDKAGADALVKGVREVIGKGHPLKAQLTEEEKEEIASHERNKKGFQEVLKAPGMPEWERNNMRMLIEDYDKKIRAVQARATARDAETTKQLIGQMLLAGPQGDQARETLMSMIRENPGNFLPAMAGALQKASPAEVDRLVEEEKQSEILKAIEHTLEQSERRAKAGVDRAHGGGAPATVDQVKAIVEEAGLHRRFGPEAMKDVIKEITRSGLNPNQAREAIGLMPWLLGQDKTMTERLMHGPTGRKMMMGGFPEAPKEGPVSKEQALKMVRGNALLRRLNPTALEDVAKHLIGLDAGQAEEVMAGMTPADIEKNARDRMGGHIGRGAADLMRNRVAAAKAKGPGKPGEDPLVKEVQDQLKAAGEPGDAKAIAKQMREQFDHQVKRVMLEQGVGRKMATYMAAQQNAVAAFPQLSQPAQWVGLTQKAHSIATNALNLPNQLPDLARAQLKELTAIRTALADMARKAQAPSPPGKLP